MRYEENWLDSYLKYTAPLESPTNYHIWCGLSIISTCLRRRVWTDVGFEVYPSLYVVLVGGPGRCRKSSAIKAATELIDNLPDVKCSADATTRESLIRALKDTEQNVMNVNTGKVYTHSSLTIVSKELSVFLGTGNHDLLSLLTDLYDAPSKWEYKTKNPTGNPPRTTDTIYNAWLNLLGASTPAWLVGSMPLTAIGGGFTSRVIFIVEENVRHKNTFPRLNKELGKKLEKDLEYMSMLIGEIKLTDEALDFYDKWYTSQNLDSVTDVRFSGYYERKHVHLMKASIPIAIADAGYEMTIDKVHIQRALEYLNAIEKNMTRAFGAAGRSPIAADIDQILTVIRQCGGVIEKSQLMTVIQMDVHPKELDIVCQTLQTTGQIEIQYDIVKGKTFYKAVKK